MVGDDLHGAPTGIKQLLDAESQPFDLVLNDPRQVVPQLMAAVIQVPDLQPAACIWTSRDVQIVILQNGVALGGERLAQLDGTGGLAGPEGWSEVFRQGLALNLTDQGCDGGLGRGGDRGQTRPAGGEVRLPVMPIVSICFWSWRATS